MHNTNTQRATVTVPKRTAYQDTAHTDKLVARRREDHFCKSITGLVFHDGKIREVCDLRFYHKKGSSLWTACFWIHDRPNEIHTNGSGRDAGGYGYDHLSEVAEAAMKDAGCSFTVPFAGRGEQPLREAIEAILTALYPDAPQFIHTAHG